MKEDGFIAVYTTGLYDVRTPMCVVYAKLWAAVKGAAKTYRYS